LFGTRIKALKGEPQKRVWSEKWPQHRNPSKQKGAKRVRNPAGAGGREVKIAASLFRECKNRVLR
jgi:hypothetical protein